MSSSSPDQIVPKGLTHRLKATLHKHSDLLTDPSAVLPFHARRNDNAEAIETLAKQTEGIRGRILVKVSEEPDKTAEDEMPHATFERIMNRTIATFYHNHGVKEDYPGLARVHYTSTKIRPGDRLAIVEGQGKNLETLLAEKAKEMDSIYLPSAPYTNAYERSAPCTIDNGIDALRKKLNDYPDALPANLAEALYIGEKFELEPVHDEYTSRGARTNSLPLAPNDIAGILIWIKNTKENFKLKQHGKGYHLGGGDAVTCKEQIDNRKILLFDGSVHIQIIDGRLFVSKDYEDGWLAYLDKNRVPTTDEVMYQIFKVRKKQQIQKSA